MYHSTFHPPQASLSNLESRDSVRLVAAIGCVLSSMPVKDLVGPLETLVGSRVESIQVHVHVCKESYVHVSVAFLLTLYISKVKAYDICTLLSFIVVQNCICICTLNAFLKGEVSLVLA